MQDCSHALSTCNACRAYLVEVWLTWGQSYRLPFIVIIIYWVVRVQLANFSLGDWKDISITHVIIIIRSEVSTLPIVIIFFRGCVSEMSVTSSFVTYCIYYFQWIWLLQNFSNFYKMSPVVVEMWNGRIWRIHLVLTFGQWRLCLKKELNRVLLFLIYPACNMYQPGLRQSWLCALYSTHWIRAVTTKHNRKKKWKTNILNIMWVNP